jgi:hypothetical protein
VELAEVSLWLNSIFTPEKGRAFVPWFSQQLVCGNSLIGARRQIYRVSQLPTSTARSAKPRKLWHEHAPEELAWDAELPKDAIFHFLLPDPGMAAYGDKVIKDLEPEAIECCKRWNKAFVGEVFTEPQVAHLLRLSKLVDDLWKDWAEQQKQLRLRTTDPLPVWEDPTGIIECDWTPLKLKDRIQEQEVLGRDVANTNARLRLKWAMDYWCALWFWPIRQAGSLPSRDTWLLELSMILGDLEQGVTPEPGQGNLFADTQPKQLAVDFSDRHGFVDVEKLKAEFERLRQVEAVAQRIRPLHWDLEFADLLKGGGFDLIVGNPPWIKVGWNSKDLASEKQPLASIRKTNSTQTLRILREEVAKDISFYDSCIQAISESEATSRAITKAFPALEGQKTNLYKAFIFKAFGLVSKNGTAGLLHPDGLLEDDKAAMARKALYSRMRAHFQFQNQLILFPIADRAKYSINIYGAQKEICFVSISNLFSPTTLDCIFDSGAPKDALRLIDRSMKDKGRWNLKGYQSRAILVNHDVLAGISSLIEGDKELADTSRFIPLHDESMLQILTQIGKHRRLKDLGNSYIVSTMFDQSKSLKEGLLERRTSFPSSSTSLVLSGPHIHCNNLYAKTPRAVCTEKSHYDTISLRDIKPHYLPRTNFEAGPKLTSFSKGSQHAPWDPSKKSYALNYSRVLLRRMLSTGAERTLIACLAPKDIPHIYTLVGISFAQLPDCLSFLAITSSLVGDFITKATGFSDATQAFLDNLPCPDIFGNPLGPSLAYRLLALNHVSIDFDPIADEACELIPQQNVAPSPLSDRYRISIALNKKINQNGNAPIIKSELSRRLIAAECDVLISMILGLTIDDLLSILYYQFPVLISNDADTYYDKAGRIVFSSSKGLVGVGFPRKGTGRGPERATGWEDISEMTSGTVAHECIDDTLPTGPEKREIIYEAPFIRCDRSEDYREAWKSFERWDTGK